MNHETCMQPIQEVRPKILYYGTPVILLTTLNEDGSTNISPISSSWALGYTLVLGLGAGGKALENLERHPECVVNVPDPGLWRAVETLAPLTGSMPVPDYKAAMGFRHEKDKYGAAGLTPVQSEIVRPSRILECPLQLEAAVRRIQRPATDSSFVIVETEVLGVFAHSDVVKGENYIDPAKWSPLIYNFRHYFGLGEELGKSYRSET